MAIKPTPSSQPLSHPNPHLLPESAFGRPVKPPRYSACRTMSGVGRTSNRVSLPTARRRVAGSFTDEHKARRHAGDFSHLAPILLESDRLPDCDKDLPRIPSTSTGLWGSEAVSVFTTTTGSLTASPIVGRPSLPVPSHRVYERAPVTEAQRIAAQYRQRHRSSLNALQNIEIPGQITLNVSTDPLESLVHASPPSTVIQSGVSMHTQAVDAPLEASLAPSQSPPNRRALAEETGAAHTPHEGASLFSRVHEDGTVSCNRGDCLAVLPNLEAFLCHRHIHLIHEGYVVRLRRCDPEYEGTDHIVFHRLASCELCGTRFTDDDHKDSHLNSCPKLPRFHEIRSLESERSSKHHPCVPL